MVRATALALAATLGVASAFVPSTGFHKVVSRARTNTVSMAINDILGADLETGKPFDPLGFSKV